MPVPCEITPDMNAHEETLKYLDSFVNYEKTGLDRTDASAFDLDKLRLALNKLGDPQKSYRSVHVAGTKGKGSVCAFVSSILRESGHRVGLYTSPHLVTPAERIAVNGEMIPQKDLADVVEKIRGVLPDAEKTFTYFEMFTLMAMVYFKARGVSHGVFETGLGGRLDATNVLDPDVCGITPISYDHMQVLGERIEEIAAEKAAIIKKGSRCVSSPQSEAALGVIKRRCEETASSLSLVGDAITYDIRGLGPEGSIFDIHGEKGDYEGCRVRMPGDFQVTNCATAAGICESLSGKTGGRIDPLALKRGIENAFVPGRMEVLSLRPAILIDGAQNGESAAKLRYSVERIFKYDRLILLLGLCRDKDIESVCAELAPAASEIVLTKAPAERAMDPHVIRGYIRGRKVSITSDVREALGTALRIAKKNDLILATGSFYVIGEVRELLRRGSDT